MPTQIDVFENGEQVVLGESSSVYSGLPILTRLSSLSDLSGDPESGLLRIDVNQGLLLRSLYPQTWVEIQAMVAAGSPQVISDTAWLADVSARGFCDKFSLGDGSTTFRIPFVPLEYWYGTTRVGKQISQITVPAPATGAGLVVIYSGIAEEDVFAVYHSVDGLIAISIGSATINTQHVASGGYNVSVSSYARKGQSIILSAGSPAQAGTLTLYHASAPLEYPLLKVAQAAKTPIGPPLLPSNPAPIEDGNSLFTIIKWPFSTIKPGYLSVTVDNGVRTEGEFPEAYAGLATLQYAGEPNIISMSAYATEMATNGGVCGKFAIDTTARTFRLPCMPGIFWRGVMQGHSVGEFGIDQMRAITGNFSLAGGTPIRFKAGFSHGVFTDLIGSSAYNPAAESVNTGTVGGFNFDSSLLGPNYSGTKTVPEHIFVDYQMKMFGSVTDAGTLQLSQLINALSQATAAFSTAMSYSLSEQWTGGYWIDGKKIYRKTINLGTLPNNTSKTVPHNILNISTKIMLSGMTNTGHCLPAVAMILANAITCDFQDEMVLIITGIDRTAETGFVNLLYTCTDR